MEFPSSKAPAVRKESHRYTTPNNKSNGSVVQNLALHKDAPPRFLLDEKTGGTERRGSHAVDQAAGSRHYVKDFKSVQVKRVPGAVDNRTFYSPRRDNSRNVRMDESALQQVLGSPSTNPLLNQTLKPSSTTFWPEHNLTQRPIHALT